MKIERKRHSFRFVLSIAILICWLLPILIISVSASILLNRNYNRNLRHTTETEVSSAMRQVETRMSFILDDAETSRYGSPVPQILRNSEESGPEQLLTDYLSGSFSHNAYYQAVYLAIPSQPETIPYISTQRLLPETIRREFTVKALPEAEALYASRDSSTAFRGIDNELYMMTNLFADDGNPCAVLVFRLEKAELLQSLYGLSQNQVLKIYIDGTPISLGYPQTIDMHPSRIAELRCTSEVDGHTLECTGQIVGLNIWGTIPMLRWSLVFVGSLVVPMLVIIVFLFRKNINIPINTLIEANGRVRDGERGYRICKDAPNTEFSQLYSHFNSMSSELKSQFEQLYAEQQALQQAKIKALQSQINPHFLNNTLEIINWEARLSNNEHVCSMIEALSTMLDAAIGRDGRSQVQLSEELKYVDAYLHITKERLGDRLSIRKNFAPETMNCIVPLLMLQPLLENAVEYDLTHTGGTLDLRSFLQDGNLHLEVTHTGVITPEGWQKIRTGLAPGDPVAGRSVGIRNVVNRLSLIYGQNFVFDIREICPGWILAEMILPASQVPSQTNI